MLSVISALVALTSMVVVACAAAVLDRRERKAIEEALEAMNRADAALAARMRWIRVQAARVGLTVPQYEPPERALALIHSSYRPVGGAEPDWPRRGLIIALIIAGVIAVAFASAYFNLRGQAQDACQTAAGPLDLSSWVQLCKGVG